MLQESLEKIERTQMLAKLGAGAIVTGATLGTAAVLTRAVFGTSALIRRIRKKDRFLLPDLPYSKKSLKPFLSPATLHYHHEKHHAAYVRRTRELVLEHGMEELTLEEIIRACIHESDLEELFQNAGQVYNHNLYWQCMRPKGGGKPSGRLMECIIRDFGSYELFREELIDAAANRFGSGWAWLALSGDTLKVVDTMNGENPLVIGMRPLLALDVWEHAYYLDYQNDRVRYVNAFLDHLVNWDFIQKRLIREWPGALR
ncbi:MAG: superoxide dismutase [Desulfovibrionales bacterium]